MFGLCKITRPAGLRTVVAGSVWSRLREWMRFAKPGELGFGSLEPFIGPSTKVRSRRNGRLEPEDRFLALSFLEA